MDDSITISESFISVTDYLTYKSYEYNRDFNPDITPKRWGLIYSDYDKLEQKYKEQKSLRNK